MAKYAILSDIHANLAALEAVLADADRRGVEQIWNLGDVVMYGPRPNECLARLQEAVGDWPGVAILGNNDYDLVRRINPVDISDDLERQVREEGAHDGDTQKDEITQARSATRLVYEWTQGVLTNDSMNLLAELPDRLQTTLEDVVIVHASPCDPIGLEGNYLTDVMQAEEALYCLASSQPSRKVCFFGHTHITTLFKEVTKERPYDNCEIMTPAELRGEQIPLNGKRLLINPGSVGQPRDGDPRAAYVILDTERSLVEFRRVEYEQERTIQELAALHEEDQLKEMVVDRLIRRLKAAL